MNPTPTATYRVPSPFAACVDFKPNQLWQQKHRTWTFRSDLMAAGTPDKFQFEQLENFILKDLHGTYFTASIFDNCHALRLPIDPKEPGRRPKSGNLVLQINYSNVITIDNRVHLSWLTPQINPELFGILQRFSSTPADSPLSIAAREYRQTLNIQP